MNPQSVRLLPRRDRQLQLRIASHELIAVNALARRLGMPRSMVVRAALRAVVDDPTLVWGGPIRWPEEEAEPVSVPRNIPPRASAKRRGGKRR